MFDSLPFLHKLWDKGIDISASVITSLIVTAIALAGWKIKLRFDLKSDEHRHGNSRESLTSSPRESGARKRTKESFGSRRNSTAW
jgi:hypothetical protein